MSRESKVVSALRVKRYCVRLSLNTFPLSILHLPAFIKHLGAAVGLYAFRRGGSTLVERLKIEREAYHPKHVCRSGEQGISYSTCETEKRRPTLQWRLLLIKGGPLIDDQLTVAPRVIAMKVRSGAGLLGVYR